MRWSLLLVAASLKAALVASRPFTGDHDEIARSLPAGTLIMDAATIASTDWGEEEPVIYTPAPTHTLTPSIHHDHDTSDVNHLEPNHNKALYFAQGKAHCELDTLQINPIF